MNKVNWGYCKYSWNPMAMRCTRVSEGCEHCWHLTMADRLAKNPKLPLELQEAYAGGRPVLRNGLPASISRSVDELSAPLRRKKPAVIAVQFMGDLFHEDVPGDAIADIWDVMLTASQHTFLVLTKRPALLLKNLDRCYADNEPPFSNIYLGVTVENQQAADERIPILLQIPVAGHWLSIEPVLSAIELGLLGTAPKTWGHGYKPVGDLISGVVLGGESGPGARPMHPDWARGVRDQCADSGVPFMFKQWGAWAPAPNAGIIRYKEEVVTVGDADMRRLGAKRAGRLLDGREHNETAWGMPA